MPTRCSTSCVRDCCGRTTRRTSADRKIRRSLIVDSGRLSDIPDHAPTGDCFADADCRARGAADGRSRSTPIGTSPPITRVHRSADGTHESTRIRPRARCRNFARVRAALAQHRRLSFVTVSTGVAEYPRDGSTADELFDVADLAVYGAKHRRKDFSGGVIHVTGN